MRKAFFVLLCLLFTQYSSSQSGCNISLEINDIQPGDILVKQQVEFKDPGSSGANLTWDMSMLQAVNEEYTLEYFIPDSSRMDTVCGMEHNTRYYYKTLHDTLFVLGFENANVKMEYTTPEVKLKFPFRYGDSIYSTFQGRGEYSHYQELKVSGFTKVIADAVGKLKLPGYEIIYDALRVRTFRHYTEVGKDSIEMSIDNYSWYAKQFKYPVFESIKTTLNRKGDSKTPFGESYQDTVIYTTSFYLPPDKQSMITVSDSSSNSLNETQSGPTTVFTQANYFPNPVETNLLIQYKLTRPAQIWFSLHNSLGFSILQTAPSQKDEGENQESINMSNLMTGGYTLFVHVDDMLIKEVIIKK